jgi:hypothetical protein
MNIRGKKLHELDAADVIVIDYGTHLEVVKNRIGPAPMRIMERDYEGLMGLRWQNMKVIRVKQEDYTP